jgi:glycerol-3-phosphate dehydrogenase (NAD+)
MFAYQELKQLCEAMGGRSETIDGLAGVGDLILTSFGELSRNHAAGYRLAKGETIDCIMASMTVEGAHTARVTVRYADMCGLEVPIFRTVSEIVEGKTAALSEAGLRLLGKF